MTVIVPYVEGIIEPETEAWAKENDGWLQRIPEGHSSGYWDILDAAWSALAGPLVIVEHDVLPARGVVEAMQACPRPWCASPYQLGTGVWLDEGLGCTKFSAKLITDHPDLMEVVGRIDNDGMPARDWHRLDVRIARTLRDLGYAPHRHRRSTHLHDYSKRP